MTAGIRSGTSNDGYIQVNGSDVITALSSGNVGIGNTSPSTKLHVTGDITATNFIGNISGTPEFSGDLTIPQWIIHAGDTDTKLGFPSADAVDIFAGGKQVRLTSSGHLGINRTTPAAPITARRLDAGGTGSSGVIAEFANSSGYGVWFGQSSASGASWGATTGDFYWNTGGLSSQVERLRINSTGKVTVKSNAANSVAIALVDNDSTNEIWRVGQASDGDGYVEVLEDGGTVGCKLDASGNSFTMGNFGVGVASPGVKLHVDSGSSYSVATFNSTHSNGILINLQRSGTNRGFIGSGKHIADATGGVDDVGIRSQSNLIFTSGGGTERARFDSSGRFLIGTTAHSISSAELFEVKSTGSGFSHFRNNSSSNATIYIDNEYSDTGFAPFLTFTDGGGNRGGIGQDQNDLLRITGQGGVSIYTAGTHGGGSERFLVNQNGQVTVTATNTGNPIGITIKNINTANYSHGRLRIESQNGAKYTDIWTDVPNDCCRIGYNTSSSLNINNGNAYAKTSVSSWHNDYRVFQAGQASLSGKNPQDGSPLYLSNNAYYDSTNGRWEFISTDDASQIAMDNGSIHFKNGGTGSANGAITWSTNATFTQSGHLRMGSGKGIDFHNYGSGSSVSSNLFDDYEEGTWTPTINYLGNHTQNLVFGKYTKIGRVVVAMFRYQWTSRSTTNGAYGVQITLPFTAANDNMAGHGSCGVEGVQAANSQSSSFQSNRTSYHSSCSPNSNLLTFRCSGTNVSENSFDGSISTSLSSGYFRGVVTYTAA